MKLTQYEQDYKQALDRIYLLDERPESREQAIREEARRLSKAYFIPAPVLARELRACFKGKVWTR